MQLKILASPQLLSKEGYRDMTEMVGGWGGSAIIIDIAKFFIIIFISIVLS